MPVLPKNEQVLDIYKHNRKTLFNCCFYLFFYLLLSIFLCLLVLSKMHNNYSALCQKVWEHFHEAWNKVIHSAMWHALLRSIHTWRPRKWSNFLSPLTPPHLSTCFQNSSTPLIFHAQFQTNLPSSNDSQSIKRKHNRRMTIVCYQVFPSGRLSFSVSTS